MANDGEGLILNDENYIKLVSDFPITKKFFKRYYGGNEYLKNIKRWCIWCDDKDYEFLNKIDPIRKMFDTTKKHRLNSKREETKKYADYPYKFIQIRKQFKNAIIITTPTSQRRLYLPVGIMDKDSIITAPNQVIYSGSLKTFSILSSRMHLLWLKTVGGRLRQDFRYSSKLVYNTFPFNIEDKKTDKKLESLALELLDDREKYSDKTISELYDPNKMPRSLLNCHKNIDEVFEHTYKSAPFKSDEERLEYLFSLYKKITGANVLI